MRFIFQILVILAFTFSTAIASQKDSPLPQNTSVIASSSSSQEIAVLKAQLGETQRFQEQMLSTVYWALGTLVGVSILFVGFGWWSNFRIYERDKDTLLRDLRSLVTELSDGASHKLYDSLEKSLDIEKEALNSKFSLSEERLSKSLTANIEAVKKQLLNDISGLRSSNSATAQKVAYLEIDSCLLKRQRELKDGIFRNALQSSVDGLVVAVRSNLEYKVGDMLDLVRSDMSAVLSKPPAKIDAFLLAQLVEALDSVKPPHVHAASTLKALSGTLVSA